MQECKQLSKVHVHRIEQPTPFAVGTVNSYVLQAGSENVLVDCGPRTDEAKQSLIRGLEEYGLQVEDITAVVLSHGHVDHVGLTSLFQSKDIPVYSHPKVQSWLKPGGEWDQFRERFFRRFYRRMGMPEQQMHRSLEEFALFGQWNSDAMIDVPLHNGETFAPLPNFQIVEVPGHAQAAIALYDEETGEMFIGDQLLPHISSNALIEPDTGAVGTTSEDWTKSLLIYRNNLQQLIGMPIRTMYPGHGTPFNNVQELLELRLQQQERRRVKMLKLLREHQGSSAYDLAAAYFSHRHDQPSLILSETLGYLDWLEADGIIMHHEDSRGIIVWEAR